MNGSSSNPANELLQPLMAQARMLLKRYGSLGPLAYYLDTSQKVHRVSVEIKRLPPDPEDLKQRLLENLMRRSASGELLGAAIAAHFPLDQPSAEGFHDAVIAHVELRDGSVLQETLPYQASGGQLGGLIPRRVVFGQIHVNNTASTIFQFQ